MTYFVDFEKGLWRGKLIYSTQGAHNIKNLSYQ